MLEVLLAIPTNTTKISVTLIVYEGGLIFVIRIITLHINIIN